MRELFDQLVREGEPAILQLISERRQEGVDLEFKTKSNPGDGEPDKDDRRNLGVALSAFSNSMGGLLVWGIEAKKNDDGVDCAGATKPIAQIDRFKSDVTRLVSQAIMPRHEGVLIQTIPAGEPKGAGYLVMFVERSERRPHRCEFGDKQYFKRAGDSSIAMEHYDIEDSFKRLVVPWLEVEYSIRRGGSAGGAGGTVYTVVIELLLNNPSAVRRGSPISYSIN